VARLRWFPAVVALFATALIVSNFIASKLVNILGLTLPAAILLFPLTYILGDVLTEVYGFAKAREAIWLGFACNLLAVLAIRASQALPASPFWTAGVYRTAADAQAAYDAVLGSAPRVLLASFLAYLVGEFANASVLARLKVATQGKYLWLRTIGSTLIGQAADSAIFLIVAFAGMLPASVLAAAIVSQWLFKSAYEALATPATYWLVARLKGAEGVDVFDRGSDWSPFRL
jgi:uncharacterized integral membrane protein (TIGR00697 family)